MECPLEPSPPMAKGAGVDGTLRMWPRDKRTLNRPSHGRPVQLGGGAGRGWDEPMSDDEDGAGPAPSTAAADSAAATNSTNQLIATRPIKSIVRHG